MLKRLRRILCAAGFAILYGGPLFPQEVEQNNENTVIERSDASRVWLSGQINVIHQQHLAFFAKYSAENSLRSEREKATSLLLTLYTAIQLTSSTELLLDIESAGGRGISDALGLAGFTDLDVVRNPTLGAKPYLARLMFHQIIALSHESTPAERNFLSLARAKPERRLEIHVGKLGITDFLINASRARRVNS